MARRRRDGRRESNKHQTFVISPSVIFLRKTTAPSSEGAFDGQGRALSLRSHIKFNLIAPLVIICWLISSAAASHRPTVLDIFFNLCEAPTSFHFSLFSLIFSLPQGSPCPYGCIKFHAPNSFVRGVVCYYCVLRSFCHFVIVGKSLLASLFKHH